MKNIISTIIGLSLWLGSVTAFGTPNASCTLLFYDFKAITWTKHMQQTALQMMSDGSLNVSRTKVNSRRFFTPEEVATENIPALATRNFQEASRFILDNYKSLPLNLETAVQISLILTKDLLPDVPGRANPKYRGGGPGTFVNEADSFTHGDVDLFYQWLSSDKASGMLKTDPIGLAEIVHHNIVAFDSFPDGNGRLSRIMADLILLKAGYGPAKYTDMEDYFRRGTARSPVSRSQRKQYFQEIFESGQFFLQTH